MRNLWIAVLLAPLVLLAGCAANRARAAHDQAHLQAVEAAAGKPVGAFRFVTNTLWSWEPLSRSELLIYTRPNQAYLLNVGLCEELPYTTAMGLTSHVGQVSTMRDSVIVRRALHPCTIQKIQPVDVAALKHHMDAREGGKIEPASAPAQAASR